jgi:membrane-bound lytic murein transglycosylase MltF
MSRGFRAGLLALVLGGATARAQTESAPASHAGQAQEVLARPFKGDWNEIRKRRLLRALVVYSRTLYFVDRGKQRGATYEMLKAFEDDINARLGTKALRFHVVLIPVSRDQLIPDLLEGRGDVSAANLIVTPEREGLVDFSAPLLDDVSELVVTGPSGPTLSSVDDLSGQEVLVRRSSSYWEHLGALNQRLVQSGKPPVKLVAASPDLEDEDLLEMVNAGLIPTTVCNSYQVDFWKGFLKELRFDPAIALSTGRSVAWMMRPNSPQLKSVLDDFVRRHRKGTLFGNQLLQRYQRKPGTVLPATSGSELRKFQQTFSLFQKYGTRYDVDPLLMMAQGYQESRLDQGARSPVGAVGIMQLMPATGAQMKVGDIHQLEPNIHAGVKYLRHVEDIYFDEAGLDPLVKALFVFASYNAGPNRILSLRRETARRGLDPNRWFRNVEYVVADKVGREPVTYVSNIFKYYVAYQQLARAEESRAAARQSLESPKP